MAETGFRIQIADAANVKCQGKEFKKMNNRKNNNNMRITPKDEHGQGRTDLGMNMVRSQGLCV